MKSVYWARCASGNDLRRRCGFDKLVMEAILEAKAQTILQFIRGPARQFTSGI